jgi:23S rRNA (cytidine1920-2'-O)/16S rRNA (cytidine1409-2'-O)-methyltransferase
VVRDPLAHADAIEGVIQAALAEGWRACGLVASPITGPAGNHEYLLWLRSGTWSDHEKAAEQMPDGASIRRLVENTLGS